MSLRVDLEKLSKDIAHSQREIGAIPSPTNEMIPMSRQVQWNRAIGRLRDVSLQVLANQALLVCYLQDLAKDTENVRDLKPADEAGGQSEDVKPADKAGGNGGESAKV
jgi:hypothetical protein